MCVWFPKGNAQQVVAIDRTCRILLNDAIVCMERGRHEDDIFGPFDGSSSSAVMSYIEKKAEAGPSYLLWRLILIAARSKGRLRSDDGGKNEDGPEAAIVNLLLQDVDAADANATEISTSFDDGVILHDRNENIDGEFLCSQENDLPHIRG